MPISTIPHTPPPPPPNSTYSNGGTPNKPLPSRWGMPPPPFSIGTSLSGNATTAATKRTPPTWLMVMLSCILVLALMLGKFTTNMETSSWFGDMLTTYSTTNTRNLCTIITATSPRALSTACPPSMRSDTISYRDISAMLQTTPSIPRTWCIHDGPLDLDRISPALVQSSCAIQIHIEDGRDAAFDFDFNHIPSWSHVALEPEEDMEQWIDMICQSRRTRIAESRPILGLCSIREIPILRSFRKWFLLTHRAAQFASQSPNIELVTIPFAQRCIGHVLAHQHLLRDLQSSMQQLPAIALVASPLLSEDVLASQPLTPKQPPMDAGSCSVITSDKSGTNNNNAYARCLPSFIIIGAQKAGTDELAVWLNFNAYHSRMNGGPETHFFDCVGRGRGQDREPCRRGRTYTMAQTQSAPAVNSLPVHANSTRYWSWEQIRTRARFNRIDEIWESYLRIGQLDRRSYFASPSRVLVYEKTPSYSDLADVRDVARLLPSVKIVFISRDPVSRLLSSYWQFCHDTSFRKTRHTVCSTEHYEELVLQLISGHDVDPMFRRSAEHGMYAKSLRPWLEQFAWRKNQILVVDAHFFHYLPQAVVFAVESFVGNRGGQRHHQYKPQWKDGYWVLGDYSKASHPSHTSAPPNATIVQMLKSWYRPSVIEYARLLTEYDNVIARGPVGENIPAEFRALHPALFGTGANHNNFILPPWVNEVIT